MMKNSRQGSLPVLSLYLTERASEARELLSPSPAAGGSFPLASRTLDQQSVSR
jgi:hypothetical protein